MTRRKRIISLLVALIAVLSAVLVFPITANAQSITFKSEWFINTKNLTIKGTDDGIALRVDQKEYAYTEWATTLPMNDFSMDFKIIDDNFEKLELIFTSMYDETVSNNYSYALANPTEKNIRKVIQPEKIKNVITISKSSSDNGINVSINGEGADLSGIGADSFKETLFTVSYSEGIFKVETKSASGSITGTRSGASIDSNQYNEVTKKYEEAKIINDEANLKIKFPEDSIKEIKKDVKNKEDSSKIDTYGESTLLITNISYKNINSNETQSQNLKGTSIEDTSKPVLKVDKRLLSADKTNVPVNTQYKIPVYGVDIIKSSLTIRATVNYYERNPDYDSNDDNSKEFILKDENISNGALNFQVNKIDGYYLIEKLTISDGTHTLTFENKNLDKGSIGTVGGIPMPITVQGVARTTDADKSFAFGISKDYANLFSGLELKGNLKNKIVFPMPSLTNVMDDASFDSYVTNNGIGVRSFVGNEKENPYLIQYKIYYQHISDNPYTWTENKTVNSNGYGLEFIAPKAGTYKFKIEAQDRQGNNIRCEDAIISLTFVNTEIPEITVNNFPDEVIVNQKFTIPTASTTDDFNTSHTKTIALYYYEDGKIGERIELATDNSFTPDDDMLNKSFIVVYNAVEIYEFNAKEGKVEEKKAITVERTFKVVEAPPAVGPQFEWNTLSIVFLSLGGVSLLGIIGILLIKPKEKAN